MVVENEKYKCEKKENKRKVGVLMKDEQHRNVMTQKCDGGAEKRINRNVAVVIKVDVMFWRSESTEVG